MKKLIFLVVLFAGAGSLFAGEPVSLMGWPNSTYSMSQSTISISSSAVTTHAATSGYQAVYISNLANAGTTIYYRVDGSTISIPTVGWPIAPSQSEKIESNAVIYFQLAAGDTAITVPKKVIKK